MVCTQAKAGAEKIEVIVSAVIPLNDLVTRLNLNVKMEIVFQHFQQAHTLYMRDGAMMRLNPYSLMSDPADTETYAIARRDDEGRGGSLAHNNVKVV